MATKRLIRKNVHVLALLFLCGVCFISCSTTSKINSYKYPTNVNDSILNQCHLVILNNSGFFYTANSDVIQIRIDNTNFGVLGKKEYIETDFTIGNKTLFLEHNDIGYFNSKHLLNLKEGNNFIMIKASPISHKVYVLDKLPDNFTDKYTKKHVRKIIKKS